MWLKSWERRTPLSTRSAYEASAGHSEFENADDARLLADEVGICYIYQGR